MSHDETIKTYYAKLLLLGEHSVLRGSMALAVPYPHFGGRWAWADGGSEITVLQRDLPQFADYLRALQTGGELKCSLRLEDFRADLERGLYFASDIPTGYGLGSSGALCAALYDRYCPAKIAAGETARLAELKNILAQLESFFHGSSSGTDPLIIYLNHPVLIRPGGHISRVELPPRAPADSWQFFLLDTGIRRETGPLVNHFLQKTATPPFPEILSPGLLAPTDQAIEHLLTGNWTGLSEAIRRISSFQIEQLPEMTPPPFHGIWKEGLASDAFYLKLCGAGGGGFLLGFTGDLPRTEEIISAKGFKLLKVTW